MNARYESEHFYMSQQTLMMGLAAGGGIGDIPSMSQSYRRAVLKNPPKGEYLLIVQPPQKQGTAWHYGGRVIPNPHAIPQSPGSSDSKEFKEYQIWRKWEDCLDLQKTVEREFSYWSSRRRKIALQNMNAQMNAAPAPGVSKANSSSSHGSAPSHGAGRPSSPVGINAGANSFYTQPSKAASFDSLPSGPEPLSMALDVHTLIPKLSKKAALFGRPSPQLLQQRAEDFRSFIDALFQINTPVMEDVRQAREIRDWFGYWKRDKEAAKKSGPSTAVSAPPSTTPSALSTPTIHPPSPLLMNSSPSVDKQALDLPTQTPAAEKTSLSIPKVDNRASLGTSASSESSSSSSLIGGHGDASAESEDEEEMLDTFPSTPSVSSSSNNPSAFTPIIRTNNDSVPNLSTRSIGVPPSPTTPTAPIPSYSRPKVQDPFMGYSVGGMMAPMPMFRSKSGPSAGLQRPSSAGVGMQRPSLSRSPPPLSTSPNNLSTRTANTPVPSSTPPTNPPSLPVRAGPVPRTQRVQRPSTANAAMAGGNRQGRIFIVEPEPIRRPRSANSDRKRSASAGQLGGPGGGGTASAETSNLPFDGAPLRLRVDDEVLLAGQRERSMSAVETSSSAAPPRPRANTVAPTSASMVNPSSNTSPVVDHPPDVEPLSALLHRFHHLRKHSAASQLTAGSGVGSDILPDSASFIDIALPAWSVPESNPVNRGAEEAEPALGRRSRPDLKAGGASKTASTAPPPPTPTLPGSKGGKKRLSAGRGGRHSISSIESYLSDSSIDAALSTLRIGGSTASAAGSRPASTAPLPSPAVADPILPHTPSGLRRSMSIGPSHRRKSLVVRVPEEEDIDEEAWAKERQRRLAAIHSALLDEDEDVVDNYFYSRPSSTSRPSAPIPPHSPITPTSATSFVQQPIRRSDSISSATRVPPSPSIHSSFADKDEPFSLKVLFPSFTDCAALALRLSRNTSYMDLQCRLHIKFHEAEGIDLSKLEKGFRLGYKPKDSNSTSARRSSAATSASSGSGRAGGRARSMSVGSASMVDPSLLVIIKNEDDWKNAIPSSKEKLILQVIVDH